ncbi:hypothetical protein QSQ_3098 [Clostridioides difficile P32]|nr:hypothetical protein QAW_3348 [Clostridioides difficile CD17]EQE61848.1 hypothetical protein QCM_3086 [Clostridioides difficile CD46]EQH39949.1 hypothetical protein QMA_3148 [Clostridioides difficile DA00244]EQJ45284.1 hypothetical protein QSG_3438 [Clostridioides difficile P25]EQJ45692.1 hypothetical protein QSE_3384 [Clostridioides difficile P24]EQJ57645.1 hypothetical protein QSQ_3098 [Clostridioides difficile P32]EQJ94218.1 hypothetical protein QUE_3311 [Clostridioides difficile P51]
MILLYIVIQIEILLSWLEKQRLHKGFKNQTTSIKIND